MLIPAETG